MIVPFFCSGFIFLNVAQVDSLKKSILITQLVRWLCRHRLEAATCLFPPASSALRKHRIKVRNSLASWSWRMWMWMTPSSQERRVQFLQQDLSVYWLSLQCLVHLWKCTDELLRVCCDSFHCWYECEPPAGWTPVCQGQNQAESQRCMFPQLSSIRVTGLTYEHMVDLPQVDRRSELVHKEVQDVWSLP